MVSLATGFLYAMPRGELRAIGNSYRSGWTPAQQQAGVALACTTFAMSFSSRLRAAGIPLIEVTTTARSCARDGRWRQAALDELAALVGGVDAEFGRRAT
jgi:hypothetical protein